MEKIMVIDSNIGDLQKLNEDLSKDYIVLVCSRAANALDLLGVFKPAALILDPSTPGLSTREFIRKARSFPQLSNMPAIAVTKITALRHIEESFEWGVDVIFSKTVPADRILKKLEENLSKARVLDKEEVFLALP
jgi:DNA-binding response OmpR family regulator